MIGRHRQNTARAEDGKKRDGEYAGTDLYRDQSVLAWCRLRWRGADRSGAADARMIAADHREDLDPTDVAISENPVGRPHVGKDAALAGRRVLRSRGSRAICAERCSCNLASYPGDGVTVGGAAWAGPNQMPDIASILSAIPVLIMRMLLTRRQDLPGITAIARRVSAAPP